MEEFTKQELEQIKKAEREYMRQYMKEYRKRPEVQKKLKAQRHRYWLKKAQEMKQAE